MVMGVLTRAKRRRLLEERERERERHADRISSLDDGVLGDIVSLLPTNDGARTQVLSSRWRHLWRSSAPLHLEARVHGEVSRTLWPTSMTARDVSRILSSHPGPVRRFSISYGHYDNPSAAKLHGWLRCPALDKLQELRLDHVASVPESALRCFSSTLRVATFSNCDFQRFPSCPIQLPLLKQLSLVDITIDNHGFHALLAACPVLQSLVLRCDWDFPRTHIVSPSLISIGVHSSWENYRLRLVIKDAPRLQRLLFLGEEIWINVSVISAHILGKLCDNTFPRFHSATSTVQGSNIIGTMMPAVVSSVKVLALSKTKLCLNVVINLIKCFPHLERLYIQIARLEAENCHENIGALDILHLRKIVLANYRGDRSQVKLAKFFISNAKVLELMRFELVYARNVSYKWIERQHRLLEPEKRASMGAQFDFVNEKNFIGSCRRYDEVHDLSIMDPFQRIHHR